MTSSLQHAIEGLYNAFSDVPRPRQVDGCPCCIDEKGISTLLAKPLRDLSPDDLTHYATSAFLTVGDVADYLYFLPRILDILTVEPDWWPQPEIVTKAIGTTGYHSWPETHFRAVSSYFDEMLNFLLITEDSGSLLDSWICALGILHVDLQPFLARISAVPPRLIDFYEDNSKDLARGRLASEFWNDAPQERNQVLAWFQSAETQRLIQKAYGLI